MLRNVKSLLGYTVLARDGEIGQIEDILFDDRSWQVTYLVVQTGNWLSDRRVLLSPFVAEVPSLDDRTVRVELNRKQVEDSPQIETHLPVSLQQEAAMNAHYGWQAHSLAEAGVSPIVLESGTQETDINLRSVAEITQYSVTTTDGDLGQVADLMMEDVNWFLRFLVLNTGTWFAGRELLVGTRWVGSISWSERKIHLPHSRNLL